MKKKILFIFFIIALIIVVISIVKYNTNKKKINYNIEQLSEYNYFLLMKDNKYGVINKTGDTIVDPIYDIIEIPNPAKPIFICKNNYNTETDEYNIQVFNEESKQILYQYYIVEGIKLNNIENNGFYEKSVLKYKSDNYYGLIDLNGNKITDAIYESIEGFEYKEGLLLVKKSGKYGIININGASILKEKYDEILCDCYYTETDKYNKSGYIVGTRTDEGMRYGYIKADGKKQLLKNEYNEIYRIVDKNDDQNIFLVAFKDGKAGVYKNKKNIIKNEYEDIFYNAENDLLVLQKTSKQGVSKLDGTIIVPIQYENVFFAGTYINAQKENIVDIYNSNGQKEEKNEYISKQNVCENKFEIVTTSNDEYKIINKQNGNIISDGYTNIQYLCNDYFSVTKDGQTGIINSNGEVIINIKYNVIQKLDNYNIIQLIDDKNNTELVNNDLNSILKTQNANIYFLDNYIKVYSTNNIDYIDNSGNILENKEIFSNNELVSFKKNDKWGFIDKNGNIIIEAKYDLVTEFNKYGFAGIKLNEKWGILSKNGTIITEPIYIIDSNILPNFIGEYYEVNLGYGEPYYTNQ